MLSHNSQGALLIPLPHRWNSFSDLHLFSR